MAHNSDELVDRQFVDRAAQVLQRLKLETDEFLLGTGMVPADPSIALTELSITPRAESLNTAYGQAQLLIHVCSDQLTACALTAAAPQQAFSPWVCGRALMEAGALACWLLDGSITADQRIRRSLAVRYDGFCQQEKLARCDGKITELKQVADRLKQTEEMAFKELGIAPLRNLKGKRTGIGTVMPTASQLVRTTLDREFEYRLASAIVHGQYWAVQKVGFSVLSEQERKPITSKGKWLKRDASPTALAYVLLNACEDFLHVIWEGVSLFGWSKPDLVRLADPHLNAMGLREERRPWNGQGQ